MASEPEPSGQPGRDNRPGLLLRMSPRAREIVAEQQQAATARQHADERLDSIDSSLSALAAAVQRLEERLSQSEAALHSLGTEVARSHEVSGRALEAASAAARLEGTEADPDDLARFGKAVSPSMGWSGAAGAYDELRYLLYELR